MKNRIVIIASFFMAFVYIGCDESFTEVAPAKGVLSEENLRDENGNATRQSIELFLINGYANLYGNNVGLCDEQTDFVSFSECAQIFHANISG